MSYNNSDAVKRKKKRIYMHRKQHKTQLQTAKSQSAKTVTIKNFNDLNLDLNKIYFVSLGGIEEFGCNMSLYIYQGYCILVDTGLGFARDYPGVEIIIPDITFLTSIPKNRLLGAFITHAHFDHHGALRFIINTLKIPVYATPYTCRAIEHQLADARIFNVKLHECKLSSIVDIAPFSIQWINVTHSIPDNAMLWIKTDAGNILHTGDWRFDEDPLIGETSNMDLLCKVGKEGLLAVIGDSTGAEKTAKLPTEAETAAAINRCVEQASQNGRIVIANFSTHVARLFNASLVGRKLKRKICLLGKSMRTNAGFATAEGHLDTSHDFIDERNVANCKRHEVLIVSTGTQGEEYSGLKRLSENTHPRISLTAGDTVIISARIINGREEQVMRILNNFSKMNVKTVTCHFDDPSIHVSGHATQYDLEKLYTLVKPDLIVPVHGEHRQLVAHSKFANKLRIASKVIANGDLLNLNDATCEAHIYNGKHAVDGLQLLPVEGNTISERIRLKNGVISVNIVNDSDSVSDVPKVRMMMQMQGICERNDQFKQNLPTYVLEWIKKNIGLIKQKSKLKESVHAVKMYVLEQCLIHKGISPSVMISIIY